MEKFYMKLSVKYGVKQEVRKIFYCFPFPFLPFLFVSASSWLFLSVV